MGAVLREVWKMRENEEGVGEVRGSEGRGSSGSGRK